MRSREIGVSTGSGALYGRISFRYTSLFSSRFSTSLRFLFVAVWKCRGIVAFEGNESNYGFWCTLRKYLISIYELVLGAILYDAELFVCRYLEYWWSYCGRGKRGQFTGPAALHGRILRHTSLFSCDSLSASISLLSLTVILDEI